MSENKELTVRKKSSENIKLIMTKVKTVKRPSEKRKLIPVGWNYLWQLEQWDVSQPSCKRNN